MFSFGGIDSTIYILVYTFHSFHSYLTKLTSLVKYFFVEFFSKAAHTNQNSGEFFKGKVKYSEF